MFKLFQHFSCTIFKQNVGRDRNRWTRLNSPQQGEVGNGGEKRRAHKNVEGREQTRVGMLVTTLARTQDTALLRARV